MVTNMQQMLALLIGFWLLSLLLFYNYFYSGETIRRPTDCPKSVLTMTQLSNELSPNLWGYSTLWALAALNLTSRQVFVPHKVLKLLQRFFKPLALSDLDTLPPHCRLRLFSAIPLHPADLKENDKDVLLDFATDPTGNPRPVLYSTPFLQSEFQFQDNLLLYGESLIRSGLRMMRRVRRPAEMVVGVWVSTGESKPPNDFYISAMFTFRRMARTLFVVVGDTQWAEKNINAADVIFSTPGNLGYDLAVMSLCNHTVLDFGSLAIWAGLRSPGTKYVYSLAPSLMDILEGNGDWFIYFETPHDLSEMGNSGPSAYTQIVFTVQ